MSSERLVSIGMFPMIHGCDSIRPGADRAGKNCERITQLADEVCREDDEEIRVACLEGGGWELGGITDMARPACWTTLMVCSAALDAASAECTSHRGGVLFLAPGDYPEGPYSAQRCNDSGDDCEELQWSSY